MALSMFVERSVIMPQGGWAVWRWEFAALHVAAVALLAIVALAWGRRSGRRLLVASGFTSVLAVVLIFLGTVRSSDIPTDWITILHHGLELKSILHLYMGGVHAGANFPFVVSAAAASPVPNLHDVVWLNLLLALVNALIFLHLAVRVTGLVWGIVWTLVFALNPATFQASFSELPTNILSLYFLAGVLGWVVLTDALPQPRLIRLAAMVLCAVLTVLTILTRLEVGLLGVIALAVHTAYEVLGPERWSAMGQRLCNACQRPLVFLSDHPAAVVALCVLGVQFSMVGLRILPGGLSGREPLSGFYPFNPSIFSLFAFLQMMALPAGVALAVLLGLARATIDFRLFGGLALSLFIVVRADFAGENTYFEMLRYLSYILPAIFLLGLFGKEELDQLTRRWSANWGRAARIAYLMAWFTFPLPGTLDVFTRPEFDWSGGISQLLLDRNTQREQRYLVTLIDKHPQCVFVGRVVQDQYADFKVAPRYAYAIFGAPIAEPILVNEKEVPLADVIARNAPGASCVRLYYGGDCNLTFADRCEQFIRGRRLVDEQRFWSRPYNNTLQSGYGAPEIVLATYAWP